MTFYIAIVLFKIIFKLQMYKIIYLWLTQGKLLKPLKNS